MSGILEALSSFMNGFVNNSVYVGQVNSTVVDVLLQPVETCSVLYLTLNSRRPSSCRERKPGYRLSPGGAALRYKCYASRDCNSVVQCRTVDH